MRLDHLLSKENKQKLINSGQQGKRKFSKEALFSFEDAKRQLEKGKEKWGCSSAGRASALHAEGQEFDPPHLHQTYGRIAQVVRAHA